MRFMRLTDEKSQLLLTTALRFTSSRQTFAYYDIRRYVSTNTTASRCAPRAGRDVSPRAFPVLKRAESADGVILPTDDFFFFGLMWQATRPRGSPGRVFSETEDDERR